MKSTLERLLKVHEIAAQKANNHARFVLTALFASQPGVYDGNMSMRGTNCEVSASNISHREAKQLCVHPHWRDSVLWSTRWSQTAHPVSSVDKCSSTRLETRTEESRNVVSSRTHIYMHN